MNMSSKISLRRGYVVTTNVSTLSKSVDCTFEHFILAINKGSVSRVPNVDSKGRSTVKLKDYSSVCEFADKTGPDQSFSRQTDEGKGYSEECRVKLEDLSSEDCYLGRSNSHAHLDASENMFHKTDNMDHTDDELSGMTLKELRSRCKKRKTAEARVSGVVDVRRHAYVLESKTSESASTEKVDVDSDLEESLTILKEKLFKKIKPDRKRKKCRHPSSPDSVISTQDLIEPRQSCCLNEAELNVDFRYTGGRSPECAMSMNSTVEFNLENVKKEVDDQTAITANECSDFGYLTEENFPVCSVNRASEEFNMSQMEANESASCSILDYSIDEVLSFENCPVILGVEEDAMDTGSHALPLIQAKDNCTVDSPEVSFALKKEALDETKDWHAKCETEGTSLSPVAKRSRCCPEEEVSVEPPLFSNQVYLQDVEKHSSIAENSLSPFLCTFDPDRSLELLDSSWRPTGAEEGMLEISDPMVEQCDGESRNREICGKSGSFVDDSIGAKEECQLHDESAYSLSLPRIAVDSTGIEDAKVNNSNDGPSERSEASVSIAALELSQKTSTEIRGEYDSLRMTLCSKPEVDTCHSGNYFSGNGNSLNAVDARMCTYGEELISTAEERLCSLKIDEGKAGSDVQGLEVMEGHKYLSSDCGYLPNPDGFLLVPSEKINEISTHLTKILPKEGSNQPIELSSSLDIDRYSEAEACRYSSDHPPIKLLSNRKALSPTSQEKLCQAAGSETDKLSGSEKKLLLDKKENNSSPRESGNKILERSSSPERIKFSRTGRRLLFERKINPMTSESSYRVRELMSSPDAAAKPNNVSILPATRGILKSSLPNVRPCMESSLIRKHAQEAIKFSQRQMQDIESLATKLVRGLTSMKSIVQTNLNSEVCQSELSRCDVEEMKIAIDNASELEDTTRRWLSMMGRDCNRFCKILKSTIHKTAAAADGLGKRKKITFADEAGGTLCHVRVFEDQTSSLVDSATGGIDPFPQTLAQELGS